MMLLLVACSVSLYGQMSIGGTPVSFTTPVTNVLPIFSFASIPVPIDTAPVVTEAVYDSITNTTVIDTFTENGSQRVGTGITTNIIVKTASNITTVTGGKLYRFKVKATNAKGLGLVFNKFFLPTGATLFVYSPDSLYVLGAFTSINNSSDSILRTEIIPYSTILAEIFVPTGTDIATNLKISEVVYYFINDFYSVSSPLARITANSSVNESCYENVNCRTNYYGGIERSVMKWNYKKKNTSSYYVCSCALINQNVVPNSVQPYVLTANHCGKDADLTTAIFTFLYQYPTCSSPTLSYGYGIQGATKKTSNSNTDMYLLQLSSVPPPEYNVFYAGWDHRSYPSGSGDLMLGIHHPLGVNKKYSEGWLQSNVLVNKWRVKWTRNNEKYTDNGSSGSPLFEDVNGRIIGQLSTGPAKSGCGKLKSRFIWRYGKLYRSWSDLEPYLDPTYSQTQLNGRIPCYNNLTMQNKNFPSALSYQPNNYVKIQCAVDMMFTTNNKFSGGSNYLFTAGNSITVNEIDVPLGSAVEFNIGACTAY